VYIHPERPVSQDPLAHYPWATPIQVPDATVRPFGIF
jgi:hypothetical protein